MHDEHVGMDALELDRCEFIFEVVFFVYGARVDEWDAKDDGVCDEDDQRDP